MKKMHSSAVSQESIHLSLYPMQELPFSHSAFKIRVPHCTVQCCLKPVPRRNNRRKLLISFDLRAKLGLSRDFKNILIFVAVCGPITDNLWPKMSQMYYK